MPAQKFHVSTIFVITCIMLQYENCNTSSTYRQGNPYAIESATTRTIRRNADAEWTVMLYMAARNNLAPFAASNLQDIANAGTCDKVNVVAQWDQPNKKGAWRYTIKNKKVNLDHYINVQHPTDLTENLVNFVAWAVQNYPAKKYCLILWNHGVGALDPIFGDPLRLFMQNRDLLNTSSSELTIDDFFSSCFADNQLLADLENQEGNENISRGILFDDDNKTYLTNKDLKRALEEITSPAILGKKLDCLGFDACFMSMLEIAYQVKDYAAYMVASEELELAKGWNYGYFFSRLLERCTRTGQEAARDIVHGFHEYYKGRTQLFTQSAIDLSKINTLVDHHDKIVLALQTCMKIHGKKIILALAKARKSCLQFSAKFYIDLHSFYKNLLLKVLTEDGFAKVNNVGSEQNILMYEVSFLKAKGYDENILNLVQKLKDGMRTIEQTVIDNVCSNHFNEAKGLSIYFPITRTIDPSYNNTEFAQKSLWRKFLDIICEILQ